jgi:hypothetical protein
MHEHCSAETMSIEELIGLQRTLSRSRNPFQRVVGSLCLSGMLKAGLAVLPDEAVGQLMFNHVCNEMNVFSPELTICEVATERLLHPTPVLVKSAKERLTR